MNQKKICGHASKAKGKAKRKTRKYVGIFELDPSSVNIGKIVGNVAGTQYIVEDILDKSVCHTTARSNVRAFRLPSATLVAYSTMRSTFDIKTNKVRNMGELIKVINEDEYDDLTEHFPKITKDMIYLSLEKLNMSSNVSTHKSLYDVGNISNDEDESESEDELIQRCDDIDDMPSYSDYDSDNNDGDADDESTEPNIIKLGKSKPDDEDLKESTEDKPSKIVDEVELNLKRRKEQKSLKKNRSQNRNAKFNEEHIMIIPDNEVKINIDEI